MSYFFLFIFQFTSVFFSDTKMRWTCLAALALGLIATTHGQDTQDCPADFVSFEVVTGMLSISNFTKKNTIFFV